MKKSLLILAVSAVFAGSANAAVQSVDAGNYTFSYDDTFWGISSGTVFGRDGDIFTFSQLGYSAATSVVRRGENYSEFFDSTSGGAVSVQAKSGYQVQSIVSGVTGLISTAVGSAPGSYAGGEAYSFSQWNGSKSLVSDTLVFAEKGTFFGGGTKNGSYDASGITQFDGTQRADLTYYQTNGWVYVGGAGSSASLSHDTSYFTIQVSAVPEPDSYAMLLAGLGVIGALVRRRTRRM